MRISAVHRVVRLCAVALLGAIAVPGIAATKIKRAGLEYQIDKIPGWVEPVADASASRAAPGDIGPTAVLLSDSQVSLLGEKAVHFVHVKSVARERSGLEAISTIKLTFNPRYQVMTFHQLDVLREGKRTSKLKSARIDLAQRERRLEEGVYDEDVQAIVAVDDVRVGDIVEIAYSVAGENPVFGGKFSHLFALNQEFPVAKLSIRVKYPDKRKLEYKFLRSSLSAVESAQGRFKSLSLTAENLPVVRMEQGIPGWFPVYPMWQVTEYGSWDQLQQWARDLYGVPTDLSPELQLVLDKIKSEARDREDLVARTLAWVQNDIRYYSVSVGTSSHRPNHPNTTFRQRFGDCKDKSVLLSAMLKYLGVQAEPALVASQVRRGLVDWLPMPPAFDHVIVRASIDQTTYWLDGTQTYQGSNLATLGFTPFDKALLTESATKSLTDVLAPTPPHNDSQIVENLSVSSYGGPVALVVESRYSGNFAEWFRRTVASVGLKRYVEAIQTDYGRDFPNIAANGEPTVTDDPAANVVALTQAFQIPTLFSYSKGRVTQSFYASSIAPVLRFPRTPERQFPLALLFPANYSHRIVLNVPNKLDLKSPAPENWQDRHMAISNTIKPEATKIVFDFALRAREDNVAAADFPAFSEQIKRASNLLGSSATIPVVENAKLRSRIVREFEDAKVNFRNPDGAETLRQNFLRDYAIADETIRGGAISGNLLAQAYRDRAEASSSLARREEALLDVDKALALDANDATYILKAEIQLYAGHYKEALDTLGQVKENASKSSTLVDRGMVNYYLGNFSDAELSFVKAAELSNSDELPYTLIWFAVASKRAGHDPSADLAKFRSRLSTGWPAEGVALMLGELVPEQLVAVAKHDEKESRMRLCEAYFYLGQKALADGNNDAARRWFNKSIDTNVVMYREHALSQRELKRLGQ